jgi:arylformamidase
MKGRIVDLTVSVDADTKSPPSTDMRVELTRYHRGPGFWQVTAVAQSLHTGSHVDSALHCYEGGGTTEEIPLERVIGEAFVLDCSHVEPEQPIEVRDLERVARGLRPDDILIIRTDWTDKTWGRFPEFFTRSPYLTPEAAEWVIAQRPRAVGFDFFEEHRARFPDFGSEDFICHRILLGADVPMLEQITGLGRIDRPRFDFFAPFYKLGGVEGAPARYFAVLPS